MNIVTSFLTKNTLDDDRSVRRSNVPNERNKDYRAPQGSQIGVRMEDCQPRTADEMLRFRARLSGDALLISYPCSGTEYKDYPANDVNAFAYRAACFYGKSYPARTSSDDQPRIIGLLGPPSFEFVITMYALWKMGHTVFLISPRLALDAYEYLIKKVGAKDIIFAKSFLETARGVQEKIPEIGLHDLVPEEYYSNPIDGERPQEPINPNLDIEKENGHIAVIIHSAGSTGLPKPISLPHRALLQAASKPALDMSAFSCIPFFHPFGMNGLNRTIYAGRQYWMFNAALPLTQKYMTDVINKHNPQVFFCVPYALKLMAESEDGINALKKCKLVWYGGSACPDDIGDKLNSSGVKLISDYGLSECGPLMSTQRPDEDKAWSYLRPLPHVKPFLKWEERDGGLLELICLKGLPMRNATNRDDGSYATSDLFVKHPNIEGAFKFASRQDDTLVLANGEKANPAVVENKVKNHKLVTEAVAFGAGKTELGLMLVKSPAADSLTEEEIVDQVWPMVEEGQVAMPGHGKIVKSMIGLLPSDADYPKTLKGSLIRQQFYRKYAAEIEMAYREKEGVERATLSKDELREFIKNEILTALKTNSDSSLTNDTDLFQFGIDSLQSTQLRRIFQTRLDLGGRQLPSNVVYENPSINKLAKLFYAMRQGRGDTEPGPTSSSSHEVSQLLSKYGNFLDREVNHDRHCYLLTGATGSLGTHILAQLLRKDSITRVYCLVRAKSSEKAHERLMKALRNRNIELSDMQMSKIRELTGNLAAPLVGLKADEYRDISLSVTAIIHAAWPVNFRLSLSSFESDIIGTRQLIELCLSPQRAKPAIFAFCSSVSVMGGYNHGDDIPEALPPSEDCALDMGYARSKLIAEHMCVNAAQQAGVRSYVFRIGQIVGDTTHGIWNNDEATPLMLQTAQTVGALPRMTNELCRWLPVDIVAKTILDILLDAQAPNGSVFNIVNPTTFGFTEDLLPQLHQAGLEFEEISTEDWLSRLRQSNQDVRANPPVKLIDHFENIYGQLTRDNSGNEQQDAPRGRQNQTWSTENTATYSESFRDGWTLDQEMVTKMLRYWQKNHWNSQRVKAGGQDDSC